MDLNFNCLVFILFAFNRYIEGQGVFVSKQQTLWEKNNCTLAVPNIKFKDGMPFETEDLSLPSSVMGDGLWIGMFIAPLSYAYVGCNKIDESNISEVQSISECRWRTGCNTFAVREKKEKKKNNEMYCKCFEPSDVESSSKCSSTCQESNENKYICGNEDDKYFSVYSVEKDLPNSAMKDNDNKCLGIDFVSESATFMWWLCEREEVRVLCVNNRFTESEQMIVKMNNTYDKWHKAVQGCFEKKGYPATINHLRLADNETSYWTGILRNNSLLRFNENLKRYNPTQYGYIIKVGDKLKVMFDDGTSTQKGSLCANESSIITKGTTTDGSSTTTTTTPSATHVTEDQTSETSTTATITTTVKPNSATAIEQSTTVVPTPNEQKGKENTTILLGRQHGHVTEISAGVSALVLLVVVIVILCFLKRRGMLRCFDVKRFVYKNDDSSQQGVTPVYTEPDTNMKPKAFPNHAYSMQEQFPPITGNDPNLESRSDLQSHLNESSENVYNTVDQPIEDYDDINPADVLQMNDYDSTVNCRNDYGNSEETYNHLNEEVRQMPTADNGYGHCGKQVNAGETNMAVEKPYDENPIMTNESVILENMPHTPLQAFKQEDNVYNTVHRQAEEYDHIKPADVKQQVDNYDSTSELPKNMGNKEETYNQLNEHIRRMPNAENVYGLNAEQKHETDYNTTAGTLSSHADKSVFGQDYDKINKIW